MGTSYSSAAAETLRKWTAACLISTKSQNTYTVKGKAYFWESSNREHDDGAITGSVYRVTETRSDGREMVRPAGAFRINGDGTVALAPKFLRDAAESRVVVNGDFLDGTISVEEGVSTWSRKLPDINVDGAGENVLDVTYDESHVKMQKATI